MRLEEDLYSLEIVPDVVIKADISGKYTPYILIYYRGLVNLRPINIEEAQETVEGKVELWGNNIEEVLKLDVLKMYHDLIDNAALNITTDTPAFTSKQDCEKFCQTFLAHLARGIQDLKKLLGVDKLETLGDLKALQTQIIV